VALPEGSSAEFNARGEVSTTGATTMTMNLKDYPVNYSATGNQTSGFNSVVPVPELPGIALAAACVGAVRLLRRRR